jgi:hypothetical protein
MFICSNSFSSRSTRSSPGICLFSYSYHSNVTYLLQARYVKPEKQPLLANGSETTFVFRQRPGNGMAPVVGQLILNNRRPPRQRIRMQHRNDVFYVVRAEKL